MKKLLRTKVIFASLVGLSFANNSFAVIGDTADTPLVSTFTINNSNNDVISCYSNPTGFVSEPAAINNRGVVAGTIDTRKNAKCEQHDYLWDETNNSFTLVPFLDAKKTQYPDFPIIAARVSTISSNLITAGISFADNNAHLFATYNSYNKPYEIPGGNYVMNVSENGQYVVGWNLGEQPTFYDIKNKKSVDMSIDGKAFSHGGLYGVSNNGIAVGIASENSMRAIICTASTKKCSYVIKDLNNDSLLRAISSNGKWIYGYVINHDTNKFQVFGLDPNTLKTYPLLNTNITKKQLKLKINDGGYYAGIQATDLGALIVNDVDSENLSNNYLLVPQNGYSKVSLFSIKELADKLNLPKNTNLSSIAISHNGKYIVFDVENFDSTNTLARKVYFPRGIENYAVNNLTNLESNSI